MHRRFYLRTPYPRPACRALRESELDAFAVWLELTKLPRFGTSEVRDFLDRTASLLRCVFARTIRPRVWRAIALLLLYAFSMALVSILHRYWCNMYQIESYRV